MFPKIISFLLMCTLTILNADVSEFFDNLMIDTPLGTLFPGEYGQFSCHAKNFDGNGQLIWHWHFPNRSTYNIIDPERGDELKHSENGLTRTSIIQIPDAITSSRFGNRIIAFIGCELSIHPQDHSNQKLVPVDIYKTLPQPSKTNRRDIIYPQIDLEVYGSLMRRLSLSDAAADADNLTSTRYRQGPNLVTNQTNIHLSQDAKSIRLTCIIPRQFSGLYEWAISSEMDNGEGINLNTKIANNESPTNKISLILNKMGLIYREAGKSGRLPSSEENTCDTTNTSRLQHYNDPTDMEILQVILPPIVDQTQKLTYTCRPKKGRKPAGKPIDGLSAFVEITLLTTRSKVVEERDQDFLELVNILTQILQSSGGESGSSSGGSGAGGGSGPIYGVGFGSSTIMILMAVIIYYLKRQLNQLQEQVKEHEEMKRLKRKRSRQVEQDEDSTEL